MAQVSEIKFDWLIDWKSDGKSTSRDHLGQVVSHSVYPDRWKESVAAVVDRRHAKSSKNGARGRPEPLTYGVEGQISRLNYSAPPGVQQYKPSTVKSEAKSASTAVRQSPRGTLWRFVISFSSTAVDFLHFITDATYNFSLVMICECEEIVRKLV